jgi:hypothetical protein
MELQDKVAIDFIAEQQANADGVVAYMTIDGGMLRQSGSL